MRKLMLVVAIAAAAACGQSEAERQAEATAKAAEEVAKAAEKAATAASEQGAAAAAQGMNDMAKAMQGMAAAMAGADGKTVEPISMDTLKSTLPSIPGWQMDEPRTERMTSPIAYSEAETQYTQGNIEIDVKVVDTGYAQMLIAPWAMFLASGYSRESTDGYEKAVNVAGQPGFERWRKDSKRGELNLFVGKRFLVSLEGDELADTRILHDFASKIDLAKIAALK
jgi:hypothetical protein